MATSLKTRKGHISKMPSTSIGKDKLQCVRAVREVDEDEVRVESEGRVDAFDLAALQHQALLPETRQIKTRKSKKKKGGKRTNRRSDY